MIITYEYLPYVEKVVYVKYEVEEKTQIVDGIRIRQYLWGKWSWSDFNIGPWTEFRWQTFGVANGIS